MLSTYTHERYRIVSALGALFALPGQHHESSSI